MSMIVFCHIPKTAGTTLNNILRSNYGSNVLASKARKGGTYTYADFLLDRKVFNNIKVVSGHCMKPFIDFNEYEEQMEWITFVRNPLDSFISLYIHQQTSGNPEYVMPIDKWMNRFKRRNRMVLWVAGKEDVSLAKEILVNKFKFVGVVERFNESLVLMKHTLNLDNIKLKYEKRMVTRDKNLKQDLLSNIDKYQDQINDHIALDQELYSFVCNSLFPQYIQNIGGAERLNTLVNSTFNTAFDGYNMFNIFKYKLQNNLIYKPYWFITKNK